MDVFNNKEALAIGILILVILGIIYKIFYFRVLKKHHQDSKETPKSLRILAEATSTLFAIFIFTFIFRIEYQIFRQSVFAATIILSLIMYLMANKANILKYKMDAAAMAIGAIAVNLLLALFA